MCHFIFYYNLVFLESPPPLDNIQIMVIVWRLRGNIIRTALCWIVWHNVHSQQHTYMSSSYRSNRLGLSHWEPCAVHRGSCLELYYCNIVEWFRCDSSLISTTNLFNRPWNDLYCVEWDVKQPFVSWLILLIFALETGINNLQPLIIMYLVNGLMVS